MALRASGRKSGEQVRRAAPPLTRTESLDLVAKVLMEPTRSVALDSTAYWVRRLAG
jgi:hypothetical protein